MRYLLISLEDLFFTRDRQTPAGAAVPSNGQLDMCRWMGRIFTTRLNIMRSPFQAFSIELLEWVALISGL